MPKWLLMFDDENHPNIKMSRVTYHILLEFSWTVRSNQPTALFAQRWCQHHHNEGSSQRLLVHCIVRTRNASYLANFPITSFHHTIISLHCQILSHAILSCSSECNHGLTVSDIILIGWSNSLILNKIYHQNAILSYLCTTLTWELQLVR